MSNTFCISYPSDLLVVCGLNSISGIGIPCAKICVNIDNYLILNTTVNCNGVWSVPIFNSLKEGICTIEATQIYNCSSSCCSIKVTIQNPNSKPLILSPKFDDIIDISQPEIYGISSPNSPITITLEKSLTTKMPIDNKPILETYETIQVMSNDIGVYKAKITKPLVSGLYYLTVSQYPCNTSSTIHFTVKLPLYDPVIIYPSNNSVIENSQPIIEGIVNPYNTVTICVNNYGCSQTTANGNGEFSYQFNLPFLNGEYTMVVTQTDPSGNVSPETTITFIIDVYVASPTINKPPNNSTIDDNQPIISGVAIPGNKVNVCLSNYGCIETIVNELGFFSVKFPFELPDDTYTITATQIDTIGNISDETNSVFTVNTVKPVPVPEIIDPPSGTAISTRNPIITGAGTEGYTVEICLSSSSVDYGCITTDVNIHGLFEVQFNDLLPEGNYVIHATQIDTDGRRSETISSAFIIEAILPVPDPTPLSPENGDNIADPYPVFTGTGNPGDTVRLCLTLPDTTIICKDTIVDESEKYTLQFDDPLENGSYILTTTQIDQFGNESNSIDTEFHVYTGDMILITVDSLMGPTFRSIDLVFNISGPKVTGLAFYLLLPPNSQSPTINDIKNYNNQVTLKNGTAARGQFFVNVAPALTKITQTIYGKDNITPISGEIGIVDGYNYDAYIYVELNSTVNSGVLGFKNVAMGMPFNGGNGSINSPFVISSLSKEQLSNYPDLLSGSPYNKSGVDENARMLQNIERLEVLYDETNGYYGMDFSLDLNYVLNSNIDLSNYALAYNNEGWIPIGNYDASHYPDTEGPTGRHLFTGTFDGSNYTISNLSITPTFVPNIKWIEHLGLFGYTTNATISNLNLNNVAIAPSIDATDVEVLLSIGGLIGYSNNSNINGVNISNISIDVSDNVVNITALYIAGMIGFSLNCNINGESSISETSTITNVSFKSSDKDIGTEKLITNASAVVALFKCDGDNKYSISNYFIDTLIETNTSDYNLVLGGLISYLDNKSPLLISNISINNFNIKNNTLTGGGLVGIVDAFNSLEISFISLSSIFLKSTIDNTYLGGLIGFLNCTNNENDIIIYDISLSNFDISGYSLVGGLIGYFQAPAIGSNKFILYNFTIGTETLKTTSNLSVNASSCGGIIGNLNIESLDYYVYIHDGFVYNINISVGIFNGGGLIGIISKQIDSIFTFIENCRCSGTLAITSTFYQYIGGLVGNSTNTAFNNCFFKGTISASIISGGLVGSGSGVYMSNCSADVFLDDIDKSSSQQTFGGIIGGLTSLATAPYSNEPFKTKNNTIELCHAIGDFITSSDNVSSIGGLIGNMYNMNIDQCFSKLNITITSPNFGNSIGMLFGSCESTCKITNSYATGNISFNTTSTHISGIGNLSTLSPSSFQYCYSSSDISGSNQIGGITDTNYNSVISCFALNPRVYANEASSGRICSSNSGTLKDNYALTSLKLYQNGVEVTPVVDPNGIDGGNVTLATLENTMKSSGWQSTIWDFTSIAKLGRPTLRNNPEPTS